MNLKFSKLATPMCFVVIELLPTKLDVQALNPGCVSSLGYRPNRLGEAMLLIFFPLFQSDTGTKELVSQKVYSSHPFYKTIFNICFLRLKR